MSFIIMESVRKGKGLKLEYIEEMKKNNVLEWYIGLCKKIKYMFLKVYVVVYVMILFRIVYCKVYYLEVFYVIYFMIKVEDFDVDLIVKGLDVIKLKINEIELLGNDVIIKEKGMLIVLEVVFEMYVRGIKLLLVDIYKLDVIEFIVVGEKILFLLMVVI